MFFQWNIFAVMLTFTIAQNNFIKRANLRSDENTSTVQPSYAVPANVTKGGRHNDLRNEIQNSGKSVNVEQSAAASVFNNAEGSRWMKDIWDQIVGKGYSGGHKRLRVSTKVGKREAEVLKREKRAKTDQNWTESDADVANVIKMTKLRNIPWSGIEEVYDDILQILDVLGNFTEDMEIKNETDKQNEVTGPSTSMQKFVPEDFNEDNFSPVPSIPLFMNKPDRKDNDKEKPEKPRKPKKHGKRKKGRHREKSKKAGDATAELYEKNKEPAVSDTEGERQRVREESSEGWRNKRKKGSSAGVIVGGLFGGLIVLAATISVAGLLIMRSKKRRFQSENRQLLPFEPSNEWAPDHIEASQFNYKGPLQIPFKQPLIMKHELENEKVSSIHEQDHVVFDDSLNEVYEIGSEIERVIPGESKNVKIIQSDVKTQRTQNQKGSNEKKVENRKAANDSKGPK